MVIPKPAIQEVRPGTFSLRTKAGVYLVTAREDRHAHWVGLQLAQRLGLAGGLHRLRDADRTSAPAGSIVITIDTQDESLGDEGYWITVEPDRITLGASGGVGAFYAGETLIQLFNQAGEQKLNGNPRQTGSTRIHDRPRFGWRGFMLDSARHFQDVPLIKSYLDYMASLKLNRFHWHLTDDEAWRLQIDKYPRLTEVAAWRGEGEHSYGGFYSKDDVRQVVAYAKDRGITVVPEIEMPGHCNAALYAYPELSCGGRTLKVGRAGWNAYTQVEGRLPFCVGKEQTLAFIKDVLREVAELFDSPYLHCGGDERPAGFWDKCPHCRRRMQAEGLGHEDELHVWFMSHVSNFVKHELGRQSIGWAEKLEIGIPENQIIQGWHAGQSRRALDGGQYTINSTHEWVYLDYPWSVPGQQAKPKWMPILPLNKIYDFDPIRDEAASELTERLLGGEAPVWTEYLDTPRKLQEHVLPRLAALSEALWTTRQGKNFQDFKRRVARFNGRAEPLPQAVVVPDAVSGALTAVKKVR